MRAVRGGLWVGLAGVMGIPLVTASAHHASHHAVRASHASSAAAASAKAPPAGAVSGQGKMRFKALFTSDHLPEAARKAMVSAHGGFAVDRRPGRGEVYFALPGVGILQISADLKSIRVLDTAESMKPVNLHNTTVWHAADGTSYLVFPANDAGKVFTTKLDGRLLHTLDAPTGEKDLGRPEVNDYFRDKRKFAPTDVEELDGLYYVTTGYCDLDYVLTAHIHGTNPFTAGWHDLAFGGRGDAPGKFGIGHGIAVTPGTKRLEISDRPHSRIERFTHHGQYLSSLRLPSGSLPVDIDYLDQYAVVAALDGPDPTLGAPVYILENDQVVSTVMPKEDLGLQNFQHNHHAVLTKVGSRYYLIVQSWNPGDFAILEQVLD